VLVDLFGVFLLARLTARLLDTLETL
jgi:hypothetical protein